MTSEENLGVNTAFSQLAQSMMKGHDGVMNAPRGGCSFPLNDDIIAVGCNALVQTWYSRSNQTHIVFSCNISSYNEYLKEKQTNI